MDGMLSQEEINALLGGGIPSSNSSASTDLSLEEKDAIGEISNICMGTAATTLYSLVNQKVLITTPVVEVTSWDELTKQYKTPCVFINIFYKEGIDGNNVLVLQEYDVKVITDLMMGGDGLNPSSELTDLHFSAISEAMNQMMGSSATSLSSMLNRKIDISPPEAELVNMGGEIKYSKMADYLNQIFVKVSFKMAIGDLVDSVIMQLYPLEFAKELYLHFIGDNESQNKAPATKPTSNNIGNKDGLKNDRQSTEQQQFMSQPIMGQPMMGQPMMGQPMGQPMMNQPMMGQPMMNQSMMGQVPFGYMQQDVNVQNVQFQPFGAFQNPITQQENIDLIMDVPLEVAVVLGRTKKSIKEILEFAPGTIIELDKLAGEPIDVMVNSKLVAKGEVVVIEESFGIRITEIVRQKI